MNKKLTPWFPGKVKPARVGVYETKHPFTVGATCFQYWHGSWWGLYAHVAANAARPSNTEVMSGSQNPQWRGLAKKP